MVGSLCGLHGRRVARVVGLAPNQEADSVTNQYLQMEEKTVPGTSFKRRAASLRHVLVRINSLSALLTRTSLCKGTKNDSKKIVLYKILSPPRGNKIQTFGFRGPILNHWHTQNFSASWAITRYIGNMHVHIAGISNAEGISMKKVLIIFYLFCSANRTLIFFPLLTRCSENADPCKYCCSQGRGWPFHIR